MGITIIVKVLISVGRHIVYICYLKIMGKALLLISFGEKVRKERFGMRLTQEGLAKVVGVHRTYIGMVERGEQNITLINLHKIAKGLNVKTSELLEGL